MRLKYANLLRQTAADSFFFYICFGFFPFIFVYLQQNFIILILQAIIYTAGMFCFLCISSYVSASDILTQTLDDSITKVPEKYSYENDCMRKSRPSKNAIA